MFEYLFLPFIADRQDVRNTFIAIVLVSESTLICQKPCIADGSKPLVISQKQSISSVRLPLCFIAFGPCGVNI